MRGCAQHGREVGDARVDSQLLEQGRDLPSVTRLMIEETAHSPTVAERLAV
jgi:hypothetical protein